MQPRNLVKPLLIIFFASISGAMVGGCTWQGKSREVGVSVVPDTSMSSGATVTDSQLVTVVLGDRSLTVEAVSSPQSITQGLSGREAIGSDGMLFFLPRTEVPRFWMKDMKFALDLIWIRDGVVVEVAEQVPYPDPQAQDSDLPIYSPQVPANVVLEVPAGKVAAWGVRPGARLQVK